MRKYQDMTIGRLKAVVEYEKYKDLFDGIKSIYATAMDHFFGSEYGRIDDTRTLTREDLERILSFDRKNIIEMEDIVVIHDGHAKLGSYFREAADSDIECVWTGRTRFNKHTQEIEYEIIENKGSWSWVKNFESK